MKHHLFRLKWIIFLVLLTNKHTVPWYQGAEAPEPEGSALKTKKHQISDVFSQLFAL